ncbi:unnamed protein product [Phytophthora fragariaefolia]|uniref:Unnamed protein product n=1 Tax=Phytophthora fragariaefolia TaxID=1490495 RepID=A0A9W6XJT8_9STRA|nr:unnamed protein product [Phytophthora fragariaefolia]
MLSRYESPELGAAASKLDLTHFSIQSLLLADRIVRCEVIEHGLQSIMETSVTGRFERIASELLSHSSRVLSQLLPPQETGSSLMRQGAPLILSPREICLRAGLHLQEIQYRDAFASHVASKQTNPASFWTSGGLAVDWEYQLKYRMDDATTVGHECHVEMNTLNIPYGFTYLSPHDDTVVTPTSLRSLFSFYACIRHAQGCVLTGSSGSGKRTLSMQVSSILGRRNFSATLTSYTHATRLLIGALYAGGTFCAQLQFTDNTRSVASLIKTLVTTLASIEHAVLTNNPIVGLHRSPISFSPGTAMLVVFPSKTGLAAEDAEEIRIWTEPLSRITIVRWDDEYIIEALLLSKGFADPHGLAKTLFMVWEQARSNYSVTEKLGSSSHDGPFRFAALKTVISDATAQLGKRQPSTSESIVLGQLTLLRKAMLEYFHDRIDPQQTRALEGILDSYFASEDSMYYENAAVAQTKSGAPAELLECITLAIQELHFVPRRMTLDSVSSLTSALTFSVSTVLVGPPGVGKTTTYQVLAKTFELWLQRRDQSGDTLSPSEDSQPANQPPNSGAILARSTPLSLAKRSNTYLTSKAEKIAAPSVAIRIVLPMAFTVSQLYGGVSLDGHGRVPSILGQLIRKAQEIYIPKVTITVEDSQNTSTTGELKSTESLLDLRSQVWVVFDDTLDLRWLEGLLGVLLYARGVVSPLLAFEDGEFMTLPPNIRFIFEVLQLRDATPGFLHVSAILHLNADPREEPIHDRKVSYHRAKSIQSELNMTLATAYLHRYLLVQRKRVSKLSSEASKPPTWSSTDTFKVIEKWLTKSSLLAELSTILDTAPNTTVSLSPLQRVTNLTSLLQSLISTASTLPDPASRTAKASSSLNAFMQFTEELSNGQIRVEMSLMYSLMWGFAACTGGLTIIQRQVSDILRREFEHLTPAWLGCGPDVNLFDTLLDLQELRFVSVVTTSGRTALKPQVSNSRSMSTLFVPTTTSLSVHAAIHEGLRSGRGLLLLGGDNARRTMLVRNFLGQLEVIKSIIAASGVSKFGQARYTADGDEDKTPTAIPSKATEAATLASVKRLRLRQISLVTWMAMRLQKDSNGEDNTQVSGSASIASITTASDSPSMTSVVEADEVIPLVITPSADINKTTMVRQFDRGDVIPFFFAIPHGDSTCHNGETAVELANCLERMLQRERTGVFEPPPGKTALLILDDLHLATPADQCHSVESRSPPLYPSVYTYLRSVQEHGTIYRGASCLPISVENLMMLGSMHVDPFQKSSGREESLQKLTSQFFPVLAASCELDELHHIFGQALQAHWGLNSSSKSAAAATLPTAVRYAIPLMIAATTVIWDRLRATYKYHLQDLARVYEGVCGVRLSLLADVETLLRLWTHECSRTLREPSMGICSPRQDSDVAEEISRMRIQISQIIQRRASARASRLSIGAVPSISFAVGTKRQSVQSNQTSNDDNASPAVLIALFAARSSASTPIGSRVSSRPSQHYNSLQEKQHYAELMGGLWAFVPARVYYGDHSIVMNSVSQDNSAAGSSALNSFGRARRYSSTSFMRQMSLQSSSRESSWIYAEISFEDDTEAVSTSSMQPYFRDLLTFSSTTMTLRPGNSRKAIALPRDVPPVPFKLVRSHHLLGLTSFSNGSAEDTLLRFATVARTPELYEPSQADSAIFTISGLAEDPNIVRSIHSCLSLRWKRLLLELYERVGVAGQEATLVVKHLDLLPPAMINQIQALMTTGEVPGTLSLEEQVHIATRVIDERLLALKKKHAAQVAQIRAEAESIRDQALAILHEKQRESPTTPLLEAFQLVEVQYQREQRSKLSRVDLRWQQDTDDLRRQREVESESVAAMVMALTRPLGVTSGKWASAVARMCSKLRVVLLVEKEHEKRVRRANPNIFSICDVVSAPQLDRDSLRVLVHGHFLTQVQQVLVDHKDEVSETQRKPEDGSLADFLYQTQRSLWVLVCMAIDMHLAVAQACSTEREEGGDRSANPPISRTFAMAAFFSKFVVENYAREEAARVKASWFLDLSSRLDRDLGALRSSDVDLSEQLTAIDKQLVDHEARLIEQKEDAERIRLIMQRFQVAADDQVQVTNEAQEVAQRELREPMACLEEANRALLLVDRRHIVEIKSFVSPPPLVHLVLGAVCVLFQLEPSWESARRLLLGDANVVQTLLQFNKDAVPAAALAKLEADYLSDERFCREDVERQSVAAASMVGWVTAIHQYATARRQVQPTLDKLDKAQSRLQLIMQEYQVSKQRVIEADEAWQSTQAAIDAAITRKEALAGEISSLDARCDSGELAMEALKEDRKLQHQAASANSMRRGFSLATWNALLSAGVLAYACELSFSPRRQRIFQTWAASYSSYGGLTPGCPPTSTCCTFMPSISVVLKGTMDESAGINDHETPLTPLFSGDFPEDGCVETENALKLVTCAGGLGFSRRRLWDASVLSLIAATPTLPVVMITRFSSEIEELLVNCARRVWHWQHLHMVYARATDFDDVFRVAALMGHQLLVLDVEPIDSEPIPGEKLRKCLHSALMWKTKRINGIEQLVISDNPPNADMNEDESIPSGCNTTTMDTIALHSNFRLILTSHADRSAFGESLDMLPTLDAHLHSCDVVDVLLDKIWSNPVSKSTDSSNAPPHISGSTLKTVLKEQGRLAQKYEASHAQLTKLLETAAVASHFPLSQTQALRERLSAIQEARQVLREKRREIQEQLRVVKRQCMPIARIGAAVFNAFNTTISEVGSNASPPLTLQIFLPLLLDALAPSPSTTTGMATGSTAPSTPMLKDTKRPPSSNRLSLLARGAARFSLFGSSRRQLNSFGIPADALTKLVTRIVPLVSPASTNGDWYRFLLRVIITMEEMQSTSQKELALPDREHVEAESARDSSNSQSVGTILLQYKMRNGTKRNDALSSITIEACKAISIATTRPDLQRRVVSTISNGCKLEDTPSDVEDVDAIMRIALPGVSSRAERLRLSLLLFPELVQHVCDRVLAGYGVPLNFHRRGSGIISNTPAEVEVVALVEGLWLRTLRALPEKTAAVVMAKHEFHSFSFARRIFFQGLEGSPTLQIRLLTMLIERKFRVLNDSDTTLTPLTDIVEQVIPLDQLYIFPRSVHPREHQVDVQQLLLMAEDFKQITQMEKTQLEALEEVPFAVVNMKEKAGTPEYWEALFQILHRSSQRASTTAFQRLNSVNIGFAAAKESLVRRPSIMLGESSTKTSILSLSSMNPGSNSAASVVAALSPPPLARSGTAHRASIRSMVSRLSAIDTMAPTYPRILAVVDDIRSLPVHLRSSIVCFRDEYENESAASSGYQAQASFSKCLQCTILRLTMYPSVQTLRTLLRPHDEDMVTPRAPLGYFWQVLSGLVLFHATLIFRSHVLRAVYPGALPPPHHPGGLGTILHYSDDDFLTATNQFLTTISDKKHHHSQQTSRAARRTEYNTVLERRIYLQVILSSYSRLGAGHQEIEFLLRLWSECLQLVSWDDASVGDSGTKPAPLPSFRGHRPMTRSPLRGSLADATESNKSFSAHLIKGSNSVAKSSLALGFLAFPSEGLRQDTLSIAQWLELVWNYATNIDQSLDSKLQALLLGFQQSVSRCGSLEDTSRDLLAASGGMEMINRPPPKWMLSFGWTSKNNVALVGDSAELSASLYLRDAIDVLETIIAEALPPRIDMESWDKVKEPPSSEANYDFEAEHGYRLEAKSHVVNRTTKSMAMVYNFHVDACSRSLERILTSLQEVESLRNGDRAVENLLPEAHEDAGDESVDADEKPSRHENAQMLSLVDVEDGAVREQVVSILRNEVPAVLFGRTSVPAPITSAWSLHDALQHYQDWYNFLTSGQSLTRSDPARFWLPGILASGLSVPHLVDIARQRHVAARSSGSTTEISIHFTLRLAPSRPDPTRPDPFLENVFAVLDGVMLLGASWDEASQCLDRLGRAPALHHRVQILCAASTGQTGQVTRVPLLASHHGALLLECPLEEDPTRPTNLSTPFLIPVGSHYR